MPEEITIFTDFKWKDFEGMEKEDINFPSFKELVKKEFLRVNKEIEDLKKIIEVTK